MMEIELRAENKFEAVVEIPPFPEAGAPRVVVWGSRTFVLGGIFGQPVGHAGRLIYNEAFAVVSLTPSPGLPRGE